MKTILLLRHAKSDWSDFSLSDYKRELSKRGLKDAPVMGTYIARLGLIPNLILASPARRAEQTAELAASASGYPHPIQWVEDFYGGDSTVILAALQQLDDAVERVLVVGHNPTMEECTSLLCTGEDKALRVRLPTAALVCLTFEFGPWTGLSAGAATLQWITIPRQLQVI